MLKGPSSYSSQFASTRHQLHELLIQAPVPIVIFSGPFLIIEIINNKCLEMWSKKRDDVLNKPLFDVFPETRGKGFEKIFEKVYETGETYTATELEAEIIPYGKSNIGWFNTVYEPLRNKDGKVIGIMCVATEVTEQVLARKKIEESEEKYKQLSETLEQQVDQRTAQLVDLNKTLAEKNLDLANTQNFLQQLIDVSVEFILVLDKDLHFVTLNKKFEDAMGFAREDVKGKYLFEINPTAKGTIQHESILKALKGETIYLDKRKAIAKPEFFVDTYFIPLVLKEKIEGVIIMSRDVTEILRSEKILENKNKELNEAQQIALLGSWDWNPDTNEVKWSEQMYRIYGYDDERFPVTFEKAIEKMLPSDAERARQRMKDHIAEAQRLFTEKGQMEFHNPPSEYPIILSDGSKKILRGAGKIVLTNDGKVLRVIGTVQDITNQKLIEKELINANKKLEERNQFVEKLINSSLDLIMVVDKELRFLTLNKKAETIINNYYAGNLIGKKITDVNPSLKGTQPYEDLLHAFKGEIIIRDNVKSTISENYYEHNYVPLFKTDVEVYAVMVISHDITENIKQIEELKKAIAADKLKSDFIKMASHELKTPVTSIKGYAQLLLNALKKEEEGERNISPLLIKSSLISIDKQISRLTRLMSELLDLSKIETGMLDLNKELFNLNELAIETVQDILYGHSRHTINLFHDYWCNVYGDKDRIGQVLINFLTNAIKYSPATDRIEVWIQRSEKNAVLVKVKDSGIGIDKKYHEKIFERFYRVEGKEEQTYPGFGIGLFIANEIIQRHDGFINLASEKGKGSVFTFTLPVAPNKSNINE
jgi:PAS domain S-box-containing protein